jgi:ABC-type transporter Mla MlaB component
VGKIDARTALKLAAFVIAQLTVARVVVMDLDGVRCRGSAGLSALFEANELATQDDRAVRLGGQLQGRQLGTARHRTAGTRHLRRQRARRREELT